MPRESSEERKRRAEKIIASLEATYPDAHCELDFKNPFQLLVATVLSAQTTDKRVNLVTPTLFARYPTAADYAGADRDELARRSVSTHQTLSSARAVHARRAGRWRTRFFLQRPDSTGVWLASRNGICGGPGVAAGSRFTDAPRTGARRQ